MKIDDIRINPKNPRYIKDAKFKKLKSSIKEFPKMMELRPIIIDDTGLILGGNMRYIALRDLKYTEIPDNWVVKASKLTEEEKRRFILTDNIGLGEFNYDILISEWNLEELKIWDTELEGIKEIFKGGASISDEDISRKTGLREDSEGKRYSEYINGLIKLTCPYCLKTFEIKKDEL